MQTMRIVLQITNNWIYESCDLNRTCSGYHVNNTNINTEGKKREKENVKIKMKRFSSIQQKGEVRMYKRQKKI